MGRRRKDSFVKFGERIRKQRMQKKRAEARKIARLKKMDLKIKRQEEKRKHKEFLKFVAEERKRTTIQHN